MKLEAIPLAVLSLTMTPNLGQQPVDYNRLIDDAERRTLRLPPKAFPELPSDVVRELQRRGCTIPQEVFTKKPHNIIQGQFARPGQTDWAVLCSVNGVSSIFVFWNGSDKNPTEIAKMEDRIFLREITANIIGFSRRISVVGEDFIMRHYKAYGGSKPPRIEHQGIDDDFVEKASVTWYLYAGKWFKLTRAD